MDVQEMPNIVPMEEREWFVLFAICVAGKSAKQTQAKLNAMLRDMYEHTPYSINETVFGMLWWANKHGQLENYIREHKLGQYNRILKAIREILLTDLSVKTDLTVEKLEAIPGIGPKTARFICLYCNEDCEAVPLDTHILKYLAINYPAFNVPKSTPPKGKKYKELEEMFQYCAKREGKTVRQLDTEVWQSYAKQ